MSPARKTCKPKPSVTRSSVTCHRYREMETVYESLPKPHGTTSESVSWVNMSAAPNISRTALGRMYERRTRHGQRKPPFLSPKTPRPTATSNLGGRSIGPKDNGELGKSHFATRNSTSTRILSRTIWRILPSVCCGLRARPSDSIGISTVIFVFLETLSTQILSARHQSIVQLITKTA